AWPSLLQDLPRAVLRRLQEMRRLRRAGIGGRALAAAHFGMAIDGHIGNPGQELGGAILAAAELEEPRRVIDETRRVARGDEVGMGDDIVEEGEVGRDP